MVSVCLDNFIAYHCMLPENTQRNFVKKDVMHRTRTKQQLVRSCISSNVRSMSLCVYGITLWNALRTDIKSKNSVNAFKKVAQNTLSVTMNSYLLLCILR